MIVKNLVLTEAVAAQDLLFNRQTMNIDEVVEP